MFEREGFACFATDNSKEAFEYINQNEIAIVILDVRLKNNEKGEQLLKEIIKNNNDLPVIMITGYGSIESAVDAMRNGAVDYILKPIDNTYILETVRRYIELSQLKRDNMYLKNELISKVYNYDIITQDASINSLISLADKVKNTNASVLITGESGTGKEMFARYIHFTGNRKDFPFVSINCAALSESLLLSELFGHERGAFTNAIEKQIGKFELAHRGTIFLDEIGDMSLSVQSKLLRVLEESSFERVGGTKKIYVDIRIIAATNKSLNDLISMNLFRDDLYYRINTIKMQIPPLRDHPSDIPLLINYYMKKYSEEYHKPMLEIPQEFLTYCMSYNWPGNIRELKNMINQAVLLSNISILDIPEFARAGNKITENKMIKDIQTETKEIVFPTPDLNKYLTLFEYTKEIKQIAEREYLLCVLKREKWNNSRAARVMKISRKTLLRKIIQYGLTRP